MKYHLPKCRHRGRQLSPGRFDCALGRDGPHGPQKMVVPAAGVKVSRCMDCFYCDWVGSPAGAVLQQPRPRSRVSYCGRRGRWEWVLLGPDGLVVDSGSEDSEEKAREAVKCRPPESE